MTSSARAFWIVRPGFGEIREQPLPEVEPGMVLVESAYSAISRGTESLVFQGRVPSSETTRMRCPHQEGDFPGPVKYGYANVGHVTQGPEALRGRAVFCLHPHQSAYVVAERSVIPVPEGVPLERAVLAANLETALNAMWDARPLFGDRISIVGGGSIGCLVTYLAARILGAHVELVDVCPARQGIAEALGARFATPNTAKPERDLVIHASATPEGLSTALALAAPEATVLELSWFGEGNVAVPLGQAFHARRLSLRSSQVGSLSPNARRRYDHRGRLELALALCADPVLDCLFSEESKFEALPSTLERLARPGSDVVCHRVRYAE